jgi:hypothetical protein
MDDPHDIIDDPEFVNITPGSEDYHLQGGSAAIDAGDPDPAYDDADASRNDMGAYGGPDPMVDSEIPQF